MHFSAMILCTFFHIITHSEWLKTLTEIKLSGFHSNDFSALVIQLLSNLG
jgi:hypothetical protein